MAGGFLHKYNSLIENHILDRIIERHGHNVEHLLGREIIQRSGEPTHLNSLRHKCCSNGTTTTCSTATHPGYRTATHSGHRTATHSGQSTNTSGQSTNTTGQSATGGLDSTACAAANWQTCSWVNLNAGTTHTHATTGTRGQTRQRIHSTRASGCATTLSGTLTGASAALVIGRTG